MAKRTGWIPSSAGICGNTAAPAGTSGADSSAISSSGHRGYDAQLIAIFDGRRQIVQIANILIIEVNVHEATHLTLFDDTFHDCGETSPQVFQRSLTCDTVLAHH